MVDARLLAVPNSFHGPGTNPGNLSGTIHAIPAAPRSYTDTGPQGVGFYR